MKKRSLRPFLFDARTECTPCSIALLKRILPIFWNVRGISWSTHRYSHNLPRAGRLRVMYNAKKKDDHDQFCCWCCCCCYASFLKKKKKKNTWGIIDQDIIRNTQQAKTMLAWTRLIRRKRRREPCAPCWSHSLCSLWYIMLKI